MARSDKRLTTRIFRRFTTLLPGHSTPGSNELKVSQGLPYPYGAHKILDGVNFALFSKNATKVELLFFQTEHPETPFAILPLDPIQNRTGDIWHVMVYELDTEKTLYGWRCHGPFAPKLGHRFNSEAILCDPYAYALSAGYPWGSKNTLRRCKIVEEDITKHKQIKVNYHRSESILYELNVRGFTANPNAGVSSPGTYAGLIEKIPYFKELGITAVELLPIAEFNEQDVLYKNPHTGESLRNLWGYNSLAFFAPKAGFSDTGDPREEFRELVKEFHKANIEVILDVVFNHTAESDENGKTLSFRGIDNSIYYLLDAEGRYLNYSGCGNTLKCNHPLVTEMILDCLRHWVLSFQVDGFRFDLGSILSRDEAGHLVSNTPLLEQIARDPILAQKKIIMEAWDAAGAYQVGNLSAQGRFCEWNDRFRDDVRRFWRGDLGMTRAFALRFLGSPDLYIQQEGIPHHSINFVTCHDGFTLVDLVSYNQKHNEENGEDNRDGAYENYSYNHGAEGPTEDLLILRKRDLKRRGLIATLLLSQGIPMLSAGDEIGRTQHGNNNAYCQDTPKNWVDWSLQTKNQDFFRWVRLLIAFRKKHPIFRCPFFLKGREERAQQVLWFNVQGQEHHFEESSRTLGVLLEGNTVEGEGDDDIYLVFHNSEESAVHPLPKPPNQNRWLLVADSTKNPPTDIFEVGQEMEWTRLEYPLAPHSVVIFRAPKTSDLI